MVVTADVWTFLATPEGQGLTRAVTLLIVAVAAYFSYLAHRTTQENAQLLNGHLRQHARELAASDDLVDELRSSRESHASEGAGSQAHPRDSDQ